MLLGAFLFPLSSFPHFPHQHEDSASKLAKARSFVILLQVEEVIMASECRGAQAKNLEVASNREGGA